VSRRVWKVVENKAGKTGVAEAEQRREQRKREKEARKERIEEKTKKEETNGSKKSSRRIGDLG